MQEALITYLERAASGALGFSLEQRPSAIPGAGDGVFLTEGRIEAGTPITLYPGLLTPMDDFVQFLAATGPDEALSPVPPPWAVTNCYLLQVRFLKHTFIVDGRPYGLSAQRFAAAAAGVPPGSVNTSWLASIGQALPDGQQQQEPATTALQQAALGQRFNHQAGAPTIFDLCPFPSHLPDTLLRFVPSLLASPDSGGGSAGVRWVPLVLAQADFSAPPDGSPLELYVDYGTDPLHIGFQPNAW